MGQVFSQPRATAWYPPQSTYAGGGLMCTAVAAQWVRNCFRGMQPMCTTQQMEAIMRKGLDKCMLTQDEALESIGLTIGLARREIFGAANEEHLPRGSADCVSFYSLPAEITPNSGMLFTSRNHTSAVFCDAAGTFFVFDSGVASIQRVSVDDLVAALDAAHYKVVDFSATLLSFGWTCQNCAGAWLETVNPADATRCSVCGEPRVRKSMRSASIASGSCLSTGTAAPPQQEHPAGRKHRNGNRKRKSPCDEECCSTAKIPKQTT